MITFAEYLKESKEMTFAELKEGIEKAYAKYFPKSKCAVEIFTIIGQYLDVRCYVASDKSECPSGYWDNDMMKIHFIADLPKNFNAKTDALPEQMEFEVKSAVIFKSSTDRAYAYQHEKVGLRKFKGSPDQIVKKFDAAFKKVKATFDKIKDEDRLPDNYKEVVAKKGY